MNELLKKIRSNPSHFLKVAAFKVFVAPIKYGRGKDYDAAGYWEERLRKYRLSLQGVGDEGLSQEDNVKMYQKAGQRFLQLCKQEGVDFRKSRVLEIGCGTGFYTKILVDQGVKNYLGIDITDTLFDNHRARFPGLQFIKKDIARDVVEGTFDFILMIDVIQHIVTADKLQMAMDNVRRCLAKNGLFFVSPIFRSRRRKLFHVHEWNEQDIKRLLPGFQFTPTVPFRDDYQMFCRNSS